MSAGSNWCQGEILVSVPGTNPFQIQDGPDKRYCSAPGRGLLEAPLFEVIDQGRIDELRRVGPTESRRPLHPRPPLRAAFDGQRGRTRILPCRFRFRHQPAPFSTLRQSGIYPKVSCLTLNIRSCGGLGKPDGQSINANWRIYIKFTGRGLIKHDSSVYQGCPGTGDKLETIHTYDIPKTTLIDSGYTLSTD